MKPGGGKAKGSSFERKVCQQLSLWVSHGKKEDCFWRSAMSGGRSTRGHKKGLDLARQAGDICAVAPEGHALTDQFYIECKTYRTLQLNKFFFGQGTLVKFWNETCEQADKYSRAPMLIAKEVRLPVLVITNVGAVELLTGRASQRWLCRLTRLCEVHTLDTLLKMKFNVSK